LSNLISPEQRASCHLKKYKCSSGLVGIAASAQGVAVIVIIITHSSATARHIFNFFLRYWLQV
jgi:hypothetical protein